MILNAPEDLKSVITVFKDDVEIIKDIKSIKSLEFALIFVTTFKDVETFSKQIFKKLNRSSLLWFCYPKQNSKKYKSEVNRDNAWQPIGNLDYEPVRAISINDDWSALRFKPVSEIKTMKRNFSISKAGKIRIDK